MRRAFYDEDGNELPPRSRLRATGTYAVVFGWIAGLIVVTYLAGRHDNSTPVALLGFGWIALGLYLNQGFEWGQWEYGGRLRKSRR